MRSLSLGAESAERFAILMASVGSAAKAAALVVFAESAAEAAVLVVFAELVARPVVGLVVQPAEFGVSAESAVAESAAAVLDQLHVEAAKT